MRRNFIYEFDLKNIRGGDDSIFEHMICDKVRVL